MRNVARWRAHRYLGLVILLVAPTATSGQIPEKFQNLKVLPANISRDSLVQLMRSFSFATGLRCEDCHVLGENNAFEGARFHLDDKPNKRKARFMLEMVNKINQDLRAGLPERDSLTLAVECKSCHRGNVKPFLLRTELHRIVNTEGIPAAVARYRLLRERATLIGAYDFREWEMNELARQLTAEGKLAAAIAMLVLNEEFYANSPSIPALLGTLYERENRKDDAIAAYRRALERNPNDRASRARLDALSRGSP
ncbi:MAG: c-type cytochrome [Longimicrobiales bacterium]